MVPSEAYSPSAGGPGPNIILINCDDLGYGDLGCYGSGLNRTPAIDRLASEGMRFPDFTMAASVCSPSRGAMLTGCYPSRIGLAAYDSGCPVLLPGDPIGLHPDEVTIAAALRSTGYATKMVGKWHCGDQPDFLPTRHGFDEYFGLPYSNDMGRHPFPGWLGATYPPLPLLRGTEIVERQPDQSGLTGRYLGECIEFIRENRSRPFFLYLAHMYVHVPLYVPDGLLALSRNGRYGAAVHCIDWTIASILRELDELGLDGKTLIIFTSDNGSLGFDGGSNGKLRGAKFSPWEGGFRVPCLMRWPGHIAPGSVCNEHVSALDLFPTFAAFAGSNVSADRTIDGRNISDLILAREQSRAPSQFAYYMGDTLAAVRSGNWKLHVQRDGESLCELYDLAADPGESTNLSHRESSVVKELRGLADEFRRDLGDRASGISGSGCRQPGRVANPKPLTTYDPAYPYFHHEYDLPLFEAP